MLLPELCLTALLYYRSPTNKNHAEIFAVKIGDDVHRGCVPKYFLRLGQTNNKNWNISQVSTASTLSKGFNPVWIYPHHNSNITTMNLPTTKKRTHYFSNIVKNITHPQNAITLNINIANQSDVNDKTIYDEDKFYSFFIKNSSFIKIYTAYNLSYIIRNHKNN